MWIKAILPVGMLAVAVAPRLLPVVATVPQADPPAKSARAAPFTPVCHDSEVLDSRPDPAWMQASFLNDGCGLAPVPAALDGATASREEIVAAMAQAKRYEAAADVFQKCVSNFVAARQTRAGEHALTPPQIQIETHRILVSQRSKETTAARVRVAIEDFNMYGSDCPD